MIVQFETVRTSLKEKFERSQQEDIQGKSSLSFFYENDYISKIFVEMDDVVDFVSEKIYCNTSMYECIYARLKDGKYTENLLMDSESFKELLEKVKNIKIKSANEILNE